MKSPKKYRYCKLVQITSEAYSSCLNHALLTDEEEVMGLLIGNTKEDTEESDVVITVFSTLCLTRKCKQKDRVEFDEVQMTQAIESTEALSKYGARVVGWYHSHPKITVPPSHVDLGTQKGQQYQGSFVGIIISCFNTDRSDVNKISVIAFQTKEKGCNLVPHYIPIEFVNECDVFWNS